QSSYPSRTGTWREVALEFDGLRSPQPAVRSVRRWERPERTRRSRHVDLFARQEYVGAAETEQATAAASQLAAGLRSDRKEDRPLRRRPARSTAVGHLGLRRRQARMAGSQARSRSLASWRACARVAVESKEVSARRRLHLYLRDRVRRVALPALAGRRV